jgi:hypothetical protein
VLSTILLAAATTGAQTAQPQPNRGQSSIAVHGFWTIEVREPDGRLVNRYQFNNALNDPRPLLFVLARQSSVGRWAVGLGDQFNVGQPCANGTACVLHEDGDNNVLSGSTKFTGLTVSADPLPLPTRVVLQGSFAAGATGQISRVSTNLSLCDNSVAPVTSCSGGTSFQLTTHITQQSGAPPLGPIPVAAGQIVQVRVEISFTPSTT